MSFAEHTDLSNMFKIDFSQLQNLMDAQNKKISQQGKKLKSLEKDKKLTHASMKAMQEFSQALE